MDWEAIALLQKKFHNNIEIHDEFSLIKNIGNMGEKINSVPKNWFL